MVEIIILDKADGDMSEIVAYWSQRSEVKAEEYMRKIFETIELLQSFPRLGKVVEGLDYPRVREVLVGPYRLFYHIVSEAKIHILTIHHSAAPFDWKTLTPN